MDEYYIEQSLKLQSAFNNLTQTELYLISGDKGVGKTVFIQNLLLKQNKKIIEIREPFDDIDIFASLKSVLVDMKPLSATSELTYANQIVNDFILMCQQFPESILYFDDISTYSAERSLTAIYEIIKILVHLHSKLKIIILVECSKNLLSNQNKNIYYDLRSLSKTNNIIQLEKPCNDCLIKYFKSLFIEPIDISTPMILRICKSAFNNLLNIKRFAEYLKDINIIYFQSGKWYSDDIDSQLTYNFFKGYIQPRYDKLNAISKDVLQKASITGYIINTSLMKRPLQILEPEKKLDNIKNLSHLVEQFNKIYSFETDEVYCHVQNEISEEIKVNLHRSLAEYLYKNTPKLWNNNMDLYSFRSKIYNIAQHYVHSHDYSKAFYLFINCIAISKHLKDFDSIKKCCNKALIICELIDFHEYFLQYVHFNLAYAEEKLANFSSGAEEYNFLLMDKNPNLYEPINIRYHYGYCLRRAGETKKAFDVLDHLRIDLSVKKEPYYQQKLVDVLVVLIGIVDQLGKRELREKYFNWCLNLAQKLIDRTSYYRLLTKSSMYYTSAIAHKFIKEAYEFFDQKNNRIDAAIASYNLGMNEIYCYQLKEAQTHISYSYEIFSTYGGNSISYPMCALGILNGIKHHYQAAITNFSNVINFATNDFAKITALLNISQCYLKLCEYELAQEHIKTAEFILNKSNSDKLVLKRNLYFAKAMLSYSKSNDYNATLNFIITALDIEKNQLKYRTYNSYFAKWITYLSKKLNLAVSDEIDNLAAISLTEYKNKCYEQHVIWGNFMFW